MEAIYAKTFSEVDIALFVGISGDTNPLHTNAEFAKDSRFSQRIIHGMLTTSLWSTLIGTRLPGPGSVYMSQDIRFIKPVYIGATVTAKVMIAEIYEEKQRIALDCECHVGDEVVATGRALIWVPQRGG